MDIQTLKALAAANKKLPDNAFFAYEGIEVAEFNFTMKLGIELVNGTSVGVSSIQPARFSLYFDWISAIGRLKLAYFSFATSSIASLSAADALLDIDTIADARVPAR